MKLRGSLRKAFGKAKKGAEYKITETRLKHGSLRKWAGEKTKSGTKRAIVGAGKGIYYGTQYETRQNVKKKLPHKRLERHLFGPKGYEGRLKKRRKRTRKKKRRIGEFDMPEIDI